MSRSSSEVPAGSNMDTSSMGNEAVIGANKEMASPAGSVVRNARHVVRALRQRPRLRHGHEDDQEIHLDYAQPRTHTPHHNR
jgi:hypothetical protein